MADISITPANVVPSDSASTEVVKLGEAVSAGDILIYDATDDDYVLASNASSALSGTSNSLQLKMALSSGAAGQSIAVANSGSEVTVGAVLSIGRWYVLSAAGAISPEADATTNDWSTLIGYAVSSSVLRFQPIATGVQV